jgi:hypothetical protein
MDSAVNHILTSEEFVASLEAKAARKEALAEEVRVKRIAAEANKERHKQEKLEKAAATHEHRKERAHNKRLNIHTRRK